MDKPKTLQQAIQYFSNGQVCIDTIAKLRWPDGPVCHWCGQIGNQHYLATQKRWKCKGCRKQYSVKVGTIFEDSPISLDKWLVALWMLVNCKNGISSYEVGRDLGITQKSAWFVLHRLRLGLQNQSFVKMGGKGSEVEVDETFIGGAARFMHRDKHRRRITETGTKDKIAVIGMLERGGEIRAGVIPTRRKKVIHEEVLGNVEQGSNVYTDALLSYYGLEHKGFVHKVIDHAEKYVDGQVHTDEQVWRYNNRATKDRKMTDADRFDLALTTIAGRRLTFAEVTGKVGETIN